MAGFGIQKRGTSPLLVKRKGFDVGGDVDEASDPIEKREKPLPSLEEKEKPKNFTEGVKDGVKKLGETSLKIVKDVAKGVEEGTKKLKDQVGFPKKKSKSPEKDEPMKPIRKLKKGGLAKKGILIIIGTKDKESKKMKKGMHKMPNGKMMKNSDMKKK